MAFPPRASGGLFGQEAGAYPPTAIRAFFD